MEDFKPYIVRRSVKDPATGCWNWSGYTRPNGYGQFGRNKNKKQYFAHRASYEAFKGPIPKGLFVCHSCDNRLCVNPDHLWIGTQKDNVQDMHRKGRWRKINSRPSGLVYKKQDRICKTCSNEFKGNRKAIFCSGKCKVRFYRNKRKE